MTAPAPGDDHRHPAGSATTGLRQFPGHHGVKRTRTGAVWLAVASFAVILALLLIFILQNSDKVQISYFGAHGELPLGVALLFAAVLGILLVVIPGTARIMQLRILARRHRPIEAERAGDTQEQPGTTVRVPGNPAEGNGLSRRVTRPGSRRRQVHVRIAQRTIGTVTDFGTMPGGLGGRTYAPG
jgi:uncharacterized integral membrane protein